jgi:hypothetical protein
LRERWVHDPEKLKIALRTDRVLRAPARLTSRIKSSRRQLVVETLLEEHGPYCWLCGGFIEGKPTLDHIVPYSRGGRNAIANLRLAHDLCNQRRGSGPVPTLLLTAAMQLSAIAAATGTAKTPQAVECEASQSGPQGIAR